MHHKRRRPKHQRSGCLWCKPHKDERRAKLIRLKGLKAPRRIRSEDVTVELLCGFEKRAANSPHDYGAANTPAPEANKQRIW